MGWLIALAALVLVAPLIVFAAPLIAYVVPVILLGLGISYLLHDGHGGSGTAKP